MQNLFGLSQDEVASIIDKINEPSFRAKQVYKWLYKPVDTIDEMTNLSKKLREKLKEDYYIYTLELIEKITEEKSDTSKYLFSTEDGIIIESVLLRYQKGNSVCISTQAGCKMGCTFCQSGKDKLIRNLTAGEMLAQVQEIAKLEDIKISNVVLMGSGEPLDNYDEVIKFIKLITDEEVMNLSRRSITVSTCGIVDKIYKLADSELGVNLAVSLHNPFHEERLKIMPIEKTNKIDDIIKASRYYREKTGRRITFEYCLIEGENDTIDCANRLKEILSGTDSHINIIGVNDDNTSHNKKLLERYAALLTERGINTTVRRRLGSSINAACGQLRSKYKERD